MFWRIIPQHFPRTVAAINKASCTHSWKVHKPVLIALPEQGSLNVNLEYCISQPWIAMPMKTTSPGKDILQTGLSSGLLDSTVVFFFLQLRYCFMFACFLSGAVLVYMFTGSVQVSYISTPHHHLTKGRAFWLQPIHMESPRFSGRPGSARPVCGRHHQRQQDSSLGLSWGHLSMLA